MFKKIVVAALSVATLCAYVTNNATVYWNWRVINTKNVYFPKNFEWGSTMLTHDKSPSSYNALWDFYKEDIQKIKELGLNSHLLSLDWSVIEPVEGQFNMQALERYVEICQELVRNGITVTIVLKDYNDPAWFIAQGGLEKESNITYLQRYCSKVFELLHDHATHWITLWSPDSYAMLGYYNGSIAPFKKNMQTAATVLKNSFEAHVRIYNTLKSLPYGQKAQIGITKHIHQLEPWYIWDNIACGIANHINRDAFYSFFGTGTLSIKISLPKIGARVTHRNSLAPRSLDFVGLNYHSHGYIKNFQRYGNPKEIQTDIKEFSLYPEGLYLAIQEMSDNVTKKLNIPIYITQNGVATTNDELRNLHEQRYLYALSQALQQGYDVRGYYHYTLMDDNAWSGKKFGLLAVDHTGKKQLKAGAGYYIDIVNRFK